MRRNHFLVALKLRSSITCRANLAEAMENPVWRSNRSAIEHGLQVNATLVYEAESVKAAAAISAAKNRLGELLRNLGLEWIED